MTYIANLLSNSIFLAFLVGIPCYAALKKINVFDAFVHGAKQGFETSIRIFPYFLAMMVAVGMLRASGFFDLMQTGLSPLLSHFGFPSQLLPMALIRPFSGSAATSMMADVIHQQGGNAWISKAAATMMGSTETTFYVIAVYFGSVGIQRTRHAIAAGLLADAAGIIASVMVCRYMFL